jgi:hypothetical protein
MTEGVAVVNGTTLLCERLLFISAADTNRRTASRRNSPTGTPVPDGEKKGHEPSSASGRSWLDSAAQPRSPRCVSANEGGADAAARGLDLGSDREADRRLRSATFSHGVEAESRIY